MSRHRAMIIIALFAVPAMMVLAQRENSAVPDPVQLELSSQTAATTAEGQPAALLVTLRNVGSISADLPLPSIVCGGADGAILVRYEWHSSDPNDHSGYGSGCVGDSFHRPTLMERVRENWIRLQPGEFITQTVMLSSQFARFRPGTVDYWLEYTSPRLTAKELVQLRAAGYFAPTKSARTQSETYKCVEEPTAPSP